MQNRIKNVDKINNIKRRQIIDGLNYIDLNNDNGIIQKVIVFGSSVTDDCDENSDVDLCLVSDYDTANTTFFTIYGNLPIIMDDLCDILLYSKTKGKLKSEIDDKGVVIYEY